MSAEEKKTKTSEVGLAEAGGLLNEMVAKIMGDVVIPSISSLDPVVQAALLTRLSSECQRARAHLLAETARKAVESRGDG